MGKVQANRYLLIWVRKIKENIKSFKELGPYYYFLNSIRLYLEYIDEVPKQVGTYLYVGMYQTDSRLY